MARPRRRRWGGRAHHRRGRHARRPRVRGRAGGAVDLYVRTAALRCGASIVFKQEGRAQLGALAGTSIRFQGRRSRSPAFAGASSDRSGRRTRRRARTPTTRSGKARAGPRLAGRVRLRLPQGRETSGGPAPTTASARRGLGRRRLVPRLPALRQDVFGFHSFLRDRPVISNLTPDGPRREGRRPLGVRGADDARAESTIRLASDDCANNHFEFARPSRPCNEVQCFDLSDADDPSGDRCPFCEPLFARRYPRGRRARLRTTRRHTACFAAGSRSARRRARRPQRRSGRHSTAASSFMAYMTSITDQFEFVTQELGQQPDFKEAGCRRRRRSGLAERHGSRHARSACASTDATIAS